jgi:hypothetical protein
MGRPAEAQKEIEGAGPLLAKSQNRRTLLDFEIVAARVSAANGEPTQTGDLEATLSKANQLGFVPQQFEARLALGELEMQSGKRVQGRARLTALEKDASAKGFLLIARKAAAAAK